MGVREHASAKLRPCLNCRRLTSFGPRCPSCAAAHDAGRTIVYRSARWRRLSRRTISSWVAEHGYLCPGFDVPAHVSFDLTADHRVPLDRGGDPYDQRNVGVLCRGCNARKMAR